MEYRTYVPAPPLSSFIERFWICSDVPAHSRERILPSGTVELVVNLCSDEILIVNPTDNDTITRYSGAVVSGTYERFFVIDPLQHASILGVHFRPGGAAPFLQVPLCELTSRHIDLETLWGGQARSIRDRLCAADTADARFAILSEALLQRLRPAAIHPAVATALSAFDHPASVGTLVSGIVREVGISHRRFTQLFTRAVGLPPKLYFRAQRFQRARDLASSPSQRGWAEIAAACGYFDQAHLNRDFMAFSGFSPGAYRRQGVDDVLPNHVAQLA